MIIRTMKEMETNTTEVRLTYFCKFRVPIVMYIVTVMFLSSRLTISFPFGSGIIIATMSSTPVGQGARREGERDGGSQSEMSGQSNIQPNNDTAFDNSMSDLITGSNTKI